MQERIMENTYSSAEKIKRNMTFVHLTSRANFHRRHCRRSHAAGTGADEIKLYVFSCPDKFPTFLQKKVYEYLPPKKGYSYLHFRPSLILP